MVSARETKGREKTTSPAEFQPIRLSLVPEHPQTNKTISRGTAPTGRQTSLPQRSLRSAVSQCAGGSGREAEEWSQDRACERTKSGAEPALDREEAAAYGQSKSQEERGFLTTAGCLVQTLSFSSTSLQ